MTAPANDNRSVTEDTKIRTGTTHCPICAAETVMDYRPFCSRHCADLDLSRWLNGVYAVPARPDPEMDEEALDAIIIELERSLPQDKG